MNNEWMVVGRLEDVDSDMNVVRVEAFGETLCIGLVNGNVFAVQDLCTHGEGSLSEGWIEGNAVVCPLHQGSFDLATGEPADAPASEALKTYEARLEDGEILLRDLRQ